MKMHAAVVVEVGAGVSTVAVDDHVIPLYTPECGECNFCTSGKPIYVKPSEPHKAKA